MTPDERKKLREVVKCWREYIKRNTPYEEELAYINRGALEELIDGIDTLEAAVAVKDEALRHYADRKKWDTFLVEYGEIAGSKDGDMCNAFEHDSESPWEVAEEALTPNAGAELLSELRRLRDALERIARIENKPTGGDWDEITEARCIAATALGLKASLKSGGRE